ncbi:hypothetical protein PS15m_003292 [Mucor circinelloides]
MKGVLASICALALLSVTNATFPNDLFFHHHPDLVLNKNQIVNKNSLPQDNSRGGRGHYRPSYPPPSRNAYHGNPGRNAYRHSGGAPPNRANYNHHGNRNRYEPRSVPPVQKLSYNKDGSIKWANKIAASYDQQQGQAQPQQDYGQYYDQDQQQQKSNNQPQGQYNDYYGGNDGQYGNNNNGYYGGSSNQQQNDYYGPNNQQQNDYNGPSRPYSDGNQGNSYYQDDQQQSPNPYYGQDNDYYNADQNGYYDDGYSNNNNYGNGNYGGSNNNNNNNGYGDNSNNDDQNQNGNNNQDTATHSKKNVTAGFAGGIRLAGALPDDGYNRGQGTFYDLETRVGSCGKQNKNSELVAAVNSEQMGDNGRNNPNCGKDIEVVGPSGKTIQVTVVDNCKTCKSGGLDLSPAAFEEIGDFSHGSVPIKWKFV